MDDVAIIILARSTIRWKSINTKTSGRLLKDKRGKLVAAKAEKVIYNVYLFVGKFLLKYQLKSN